jgi:hypothetical protein
VGLQSLSDLHDFKQSRSCHGSRFSVCKDSGIRSAQTSFAAQAWDSQVDVHNPKAGPVVQELGPGQRQVKPSAHWAVAMQGSPVRFGFTSTMPCFSLLTMLAPIPAATTFTVYEPGNVYSCAGAVSGSTGEPSPKSH